MPRRSDPIPFRCPTPGCGSHQYEAVVVKRPSGPEYQTPFYSCHRCSVMFRDPEAFSNLREKAGAPTMDRSIFRGRPTDKDCRLREDAEWQQLASAYVRAKQVHEAASFEVDGARERLLAATEHSSETGSGVTVTRFSKAGAVDYKKIPELKGVNLEQYRGAAGSAHHDRKLTFIHPAWCRVNFNFLDDGYGADLRFPIDGGK